MAFRVCRTADCIDASDLVSEVFAVVTGVGVVNDSDDTSVTSGAGRLAGTELSASVVPTEAHCDDWTRGEVGTEAAATMSGSRLN